MASTKKMESDKSNSETSTSITDKDEGTLEIDVSIETNNSRNKRSADSNKENTPAKKARSKPQPQIIKNMKEYFENNTLEQLTTTTLRHWLKEKQLHCTTRERKDSLIQKVRSYFLEGTNL